MSQKLGCTSLLGRHGLHFSAFDDPLAFSSTLLPEFYYDMGIVVFLMNVGTTMQPPNHVNLSTVFQFVLTFSWAFWSWCIHVYFNILLDTDDWSYRLFTLVTMIATVITSLGVVQRIDSASTCIFALGCGLSETLVLFSWLRAINIDGAKTTSRAMILSRLVSAALSFTAAYTPYTPTSSARYVYLTLALFFSMLGPVTVITSIPVPNHFKLAERMYGFVVLVCGGCMFASMNFLVISNEMLQEEGQPLTASISSFPASFVGIVVLGLLLPYTIVLIYGTSSPEYAKSDYTLQNDNTLNRRASVGGSFFRAPQRGGSAGTPLLLRQKSHVSFSVQHSISRKQRLLAVSTHERLTSAPSVHTVAFAHTCVSPTVCVVLQPLAAERGDYWSDVRHRYAGLPRKPDRSAVLYVGRERRVSVQCVVRGHAGVALRGALGE